MQSSFEKYFCKDINADEGIISSPTRSYKDPTDVYSCRSCSFELTLSDHIISRDFHCNNGLAYLVSKMQVNSLEIILGLMFMDLQIDIVILSVDITKSETLHVMAAIKLLVWSILLHVFH